MSEAQLVGAVVATLNAQRDVIAWRCNTGVARLHGSVVRYGLGNGAPDVLAVLSPWGHLIGLEGKLPGRDLDPEQFAWRDALVDHGGSFGVFHSVPEALAIVAAARTSLLPGGPAYAAIARAQESDRLIASQPVWPDLRRRIRQTDSKIASTGLLVPANGICAPMRRRPGR